MGPFTDHVRTIEMVATLLDEELARKAARRTALGLAASRPTSPRRGLTALAARIANRGRASKELETCDCPPATVGA